MYIDYYLTVSYPEYSGGYLSGYPVKNSSLSEHGQDFVWHQEKNLLAIIGVESLDEFGVKYPDGLVIRSFFGDSSRQYSIVLETAQERLEVYRRTIENRCHQIKQRGFLGYLRWLREFDGIIPSGDITQSHCS